MPILETELGEPVVAVWEPPDLAERRYILPLETPMPLLLEWLLEQALPEFVPEALGRARRALGSETDFMTRDEREAKAALDALEADYLTRRSELQRELEAANAASSTIREQLLYGTGQQLVDGVRSVFEDAGIMVEDLDRKLGGTKNADLLCTYHGRSRLVEVKSAGGRPSERSYQDMVRHLREWPTLPGSTPVEGGALVVSHELRTAPLDRNPIPFTRPEFLAAQREPIIPALTLFYVWLRDDMQRIRELLFDKSQQMGNLVEDHGTEQSTETPPGAHASHFRRWFRRR